ncbi:FecR domain-containing protein [Sphingomonas albertensis]|uniref:FecR domain-containing protein n=1 Tax=Sphingomonas albertensis TaxID=2762591 RepID=A0ABR7AKV9_9SPHN|nr:FecR domain-containing protein [Sphingomonas albertensis]MBC3941097.1 FecR domain-containing protein [Sphingomonas albertensis]
MATEAQDIIQARAIEWHIRLRNGGDDAWEDFAAWLAEDPQHAEAYDAIERVDHAIEPLLPDLVFREAANDSDELATPLSRPTRRWFLSGGALAAAIVAAFALGPSLISSRYNVVTGPGERRTVALDPGTQVVMNGSTRMTFDSKDARFAELAQGEALFRIRHDSVHPFVLKLGENRVEDAGTVFNVVRSPSEVRVAVAEGKVIYNPDRDRIVLDPGQVLADRDGSTRIRVTRVPVQGVGSWEKGGLSYTGDPMSQVAGDLSRALGVRIIVAPSVTDRPFSGSIVLNGKGPEQVRRLERALNVRLEQGPEGWTMKPADGAGR